MTELDEPTIEDLEAVSGWTWDGYVRSYQDFLCELAAREERAANWHAGLGFRLDVDALRSEQKYHCACGNPKRSDSIACDNCLGIVH